MQQDSGKLTLQDGRDAMAHANRIPNALICILAHQPTEGLLMSERYIRYLLELYPSTPMHDRQKERILNHPVLMAAFAKRIQERIAFARQAVNYLQVEQHVHVDVIDRSLKWTLDMAHYEPLYLLGEEAVKSEVYIAI